MCGRGARSRLAVTKLTHLNFCILHLYSSGIYLTKSVHNFTNRLRTETCIYNVLLWLQWEVSLLRMLSTPLLWPLRRCYETKPKEFMCLGAESTSKDSSEFNFERRWSMINTISQPPPRLFEKLRSIGFWTCLHSSVKKTLTGIVASWSFLLVT